MAKRRGKALKTEERQLIIKKIDDYVAIHGGTKTEAAATLGIRIGAYHANKAFLASTPKEEHFPLAIIPPKSAPKQRTVVVKQQKDELREAVATLLEVAAKLLRSKS